MSALMPTAEGSSPTALIEKHFSSLKDPRAQHSIDHLLLDIIAITLWATICGANQSNLYEDVTQLFDCTRQR